MTEKQTEVNKSLCSQDKTTDVCTATAAASISADEIKTEIGADEESSSTIQVTRKVQRDIRVSVKPNNIATTNSTIDGVILCLELADHLFAVHVVGWFFIDNLSMRM